MATGRCRATAIDLDDAGSLAHSFARSYLHIDGIDCNSRLWYSMAACISLVVACSARYPTCRRRTAASLRSTRVCRRRPNIPPRESQMMAHWSRTNQLNRESDVERAADVRQRWLRLHGAEQSIPPCRGAGRSNHVGVRRCMRSTVRW